METLDGIRHGARKSLQLSVVSRRLLFVPLILLFFSVLSAVCLGFLCRRENIERAAFIFYLVFFLPPFFLKMETKRICLCVCVGVSLYDLFYIGTVHVLRITVLDQTAPAGDPPIWLDCVGSIDFCFQ